MTDPITPERVTLTEGEREAEAFLGSGALMDALLAAVRLHDSFVEIDPAYIWCACGWRSDEPPRPPGEYGSAYHVHLTNALHEAARDAIREIGLLRPSAVERILSDRLRELPEQIAQAIEAVPAKAAAAGYPIAAVTYADCARIARDHTTGCPRGLDGDR